MTTHPLPEPLPRTELSRGFTVSALGFGCMALSHVYGPTDPDEAVRTLHAAIDLGVAFLDTADVYGQPHTDANGEPIPGPAGTNEELLARVLKDRRDEVQLATKFGITGRIGPDGSTGTRGDAAYVREACDASLRRLGVETIDLYYMHRRELDRPVEETVGAMAELVSAGKVRHLGLSEVTGDELRAAASVHPIAAVQSEWSLWSRDVEAKVVPAAAEVGAGFVPYSPLGRGFLTGTLDRGAVAATMLKGEPRFVEHFDANQQAVDVIREVAARYGATPAQIALAWLLAQGPRFGLGVVPIPGTRRSARVAENAASVAVRLDEDDLSQLDAVADRVQGSRNLTFTSKGWISADRE
ncbi:aldo/keto reductase [Aestuariimicrobium sp. p3-SID1156]|uniref:aldo/keto reductase n=1 Tax=Aestuariimicrobium sp. p3-SID1156 TaxID=2916038 RepID=UPI00223BEF7F|nr:aldo/keto reductase [Aestuariimicrobium sp. p3-SID1156]MCT1460059.1 aldo/keto reductase [Aestuariimicrobium sp. p3-SID1156]